jgi:AcrR family transcriptional regulator
VTSQRDGRVLRGNATRRAILHRAAEIASVEGLDGLSIGRLATELRVSKSGVFAHFGAKEELQLATIRLANEIFTTEVVEPTLRVPPGAGRLWALYEQWLRYSRRRVFPGGCFFFSVTAEFDARTGRVHDMVADAQTAWTAFQRRIVVDARQLGELHPWTDEVQLVFELDALGRAANSEAVLYNDPKSYDLARAGILARIRSVATGAAVLPADQVGQGVWSDGQAPAAGERP